MATEEVVVSKSTVYHYYKLMFGQTVKAGLKTDYCGYCFEVQKQIKLAHDIEMK